MDQAKLKRFTKEARRLKSDVQVVPDVASYVGPTGTSLFVAPFSNYLAILYADDKPAGTILLAEDADTKCLGHAIHELGHAVLLRLDEYAYQDEYDFFGWEFALAQRVDLLDEWFQVLVGYSVWEPHRKGPGRSPLVEFTCLPVEQQTDLIEEQWDYAAQKRWLVRGVPRAPKRSSKEKLL